MKELRTFLPDLIVEVTRACDRQCRGCYAPNVLLDAATTGDANLPEGLFLTEQALASHLAVLDHHDQRAGIVAIRGGEPSLHPRLPALIGIAADFADQVFIETHGRWLSSVSPGSRQTEILQACRDTGAVLKISFDHMHGLSEGKIKPLLRTVELHGVAWILAVTEKSQADALEFLSAAPWINQDQVIFQAKAERASELIKPRLGVISPSGRLSGALTTGFTDRPLARSIQSEVFA